MVNENQTKDIKDINVNGLDIHKILFTFISEHKLVFIFFLVTSLILYPIHSILIPDYYGKVINSFKDDNKTLFMHYVKLLCMIVVISWIFDGLVVYFQYLIVPSFAEYATGRIFEFIIDNYELDFENIRIGEILSKIIKMPTVLYDYLDVVRLDFLKEFFILIAGFFHYYTVSGEALGAYTIFVIINYIFVYYIFNVFVESDLVLNRVHDQIYEYLVDCFNNLISIYIFNQQKEEEKLFYENSFKQYKTFRAESILTYIKNNIGWSFVNASMFVIMNYIMYKAYKEKRIDSEKVISTFIITYSIIRLMETTQRSSRKLASIFSQIKDAEMFFTEIGDTNKSIKTNQSTFQNGDIVISNVYHKYGDKFVLDNLSTIIKRGEKVAFVGEIGCGKTTVVKLIMGFQPLLMGKITIGGVSINDIKNNDLRDKIFYIPQKPKLFNRTLYENIVYGLEPPPSKEKVIQMMDDLRLDVKDIFEKKMDENVGVEGNSLSGGQRQIVWLLRSVYRKSSILILDEPTSALDPDNKLFMITTIKKLSVGKTVIIISHDEIDPAFRKISMKKGRVIATVF
jgi:ABC-type multidrug transport system fused ATPase/permease subunit